MKHLLLLLPLLLAACTKSAPDGLNSNPISMPKGNAIGPAQLMDMEALIVSVSPSGVNLSESQNIVLSSTRRQYASKSIAVANRTAGDLPVTLDFSSLNPAIIQENNCNAPLRYKRVCMITLYFNQDGSHDVGESLPESTFTITGGSNQQVISVSGTVVGATEESEVGAAMTFSKASITFNDEHFQGITHSEILVVRNNATYSLPVNVDTGVLPSGWSVDNSCPVAPELLKSKRVCALFISHTANSVGTHNHAISVAQSLIPIQAVVQALPEFETNPNFEYTNLPAGPTLTMAVGSPLSYSIELFNILDGNKYAGNFVYNKDMSLGGPETIPSALTSVSNCGTSLKATHFCFFTFNFDPSRFPYQVSLDKTIYLGGQEYAMTLEGDSPCDPNHPQARADAQAGYKLNVTKTACIPHIGVFDSPDSYFGHAVFE